MQNTKRPDDGKGRRLAVIGIIAAVIIIILLVVCIVLLITRPGSSSESSDASQSGYQAGSQSGDASSVLDRGFVDNTNTNDIVTDMAEQVKEGMFHCSMTFDWTFENSNSVSPNAYVANAEDNRYTLYFDVYEKETNELLFSSPLLPVGSEFKEVKLEKALAPGDYKAIVMYTLVNEDYEEVSSAGFTITISILH
ncbi:MAG: hypothetical protein J1E98_05080 [Lachnospiraceae bacterium]|nr:hypothetical protein [Lachnospiraceae bacterium]